MIFTILGIVNLVFSIFSLLLFFVSISNSYNQDIAFDYLFFFITLVINAIVFFKLSAMNNELKETQKFIETQKKNKFNEEQRLNNMERTIIQLREKLNKKDGE